MLLSNWDEKTGTPVASFASYRDRKPLLVMVRGKWDFVKTYVESWSDRNGAAAKWCDRRNYFIGVKAGIKLGQALDCTARGCPVPKDEDDEAQAVGDKHAEWKTGKPLRPPTAAPSSEPSPTMQLEANYGPFN